MKPLQIVLVFVVAVLATISACMARADVGFAETVKEQIMITETVCAKVRENSRMATQAVIDYNPSVANLQESAASMVKLDGWDDVNYISWFITGELSATIKNGYTGKDVNELLARNPTWSRPAAVGFILEKGCLRQVGQQYELPKRYETKRT